MKHLNVKLMALTVLMSMVGAKALADTFTVNGIKYQTINASTVKVVANASSPTYSGDIDIPSSVTYDATTYSVTGIGLNAFNYCEDLTSVTIPNSVTNIDDGAFCNCSGLTSITIPNSVTSIGRSAFELCSGLTSIEIPNSVTSIGSSAFYNCSGLTSITIPYSVTSIAIDAFSFCSGLTSINVESGNTKYDSRNSCNAIIEKATNTLIQGCKTTVIPNSVTSIGDWAFDGCRGLTSITIPNSVTSIGEWAFDGCRGLTSITIPNSVTSIGEWAFVECTGLTSVTFDNSTPTLGDKVFYYSSNLTDIYYPAYAYDYFTANAQTNVYTLHPQIKIDREWTTYCATESFDVPEGIDAYVVKSYEEGVVTLQKVTTINAGQGLLLKPAEVGTFYNTTVCASAPDPYESNMLKGVTTATAIGATSGEYTNFIFTKVNGELGFYPTNAGTIPAYKAYLQIPTASLPSGDPSRLSIAIDDETTSVERVKTNTEKDSNWYTLSGVQAKQPTKSGVYIHQGKKVIIK